MSNYVVPFFFALSTLAWLGVIADHDEMSRRRDTCIERCYPSQPVEVCINFADPGVLGGCACAAREGTTYVAP